GQSSRGNLPVVALQIAEQLWTVGKDGLVANGRGPQILQQLRPDLLMEALVLLQPLRFDPQPERDALHRSSSQLRCLTLRHLLEAPRQEQCSQRVATIPRQASPTLRAQRDAAVRQP